MNNDDVSSLLLSRARKAEDLLEVIHRRQIRPGDSQLFVEVLDLLWQAFNASDMEGFGFCFWCSDGGFITHHGNGEGHPATDYIHAEKFSEAVRNLRESIADCIRWEETDPIPFLEQAIRLISEKIKTDAGGPQS